MGTRGFYAFKFHGRYYVFYSRFDSYPEGLGNKLVSMIPAEPAKYRKWLEIKRAEYSDAEARLHSTILNVSIERARSGKTLPLAAIGLENLRGCPGYGGRPECDLFIEWVYIIDLDREEFYVSDNAYFGLADIRACDSWPKILEEAARLHKDACEEAGLAWPRAHPLNIQPSLPVIRAGVRARTDAPKTTEIDYEALSVTIVQPKQSGGLLNRPSVAIARQVLSLFKSSFKSILKDAQQAALPHDSLFKEVAFIAISICSASPALLRMGAKLDPNDLTIDAPFSLFRPSSTRGKRPEFASSLFQGYHLPGHRSGSSGKDTTYWLSDVLVCLASDLSSETSIKAAIVQAVKAGKDGSRERFNAIITSISHAVLVRVTESEIQHTKRFPLLGEIQSIHGVVLVRDMSAWVDQDINAVSALAHVFEATALESLGLTASGSRGIFPNEVYKEITKYLDPATRASCLLVSRAFRDFASEMFPLDEQLSVVSVAGHPELRCVSHISADLGRFSLETPSKDKHIAQWYPVIGHDDNTASFMAQYCLSVSHYELAPLVVQHELAEEAPTADMPFLPSSEIDEAYDRASARVRLQMRGETSNAQVEHDFTIFEKYLPSQSVIASAGDIMCLYSTTFFAPLMIFGNNPGFVSHHWRSRAQESIDAVPANVCMQIGARDWFPRLIRARDWDPELEYGLVWAKQPSEDTPEGWEKAICEAKNAATTAFLQYLYKAWTQGKDVRKANFAIAVLIGGRCCFLRGCLPSGLVIPPLADFDELAVEASNPERLIGSSFELWAEAGINVEDIIYGVRQGWASLHGGGQGDDVRPLSVHKGSDRPKICEAFAWVQRLARKRGKDETTRFG